MKTKEQKELLAKCRHKAEIPVTVAAVILTMLFTGFVIFLFRSSGNNQWASDFLMNNLEYEEAEVKFALECGRYILIVIVIVLLLKLFWELFKNAGIAMVHDVPVEESYSPEVFREYKECCGKLGITKVPKLLLATDKENLESTGITIRSNRYLRMYLGVVEAAACTEDDNLIRFEVLHDLADIAYNHYHYAVLIVTIAARWLPIVKNIYSRVMCYSSDRLTAEIMGKDECITVLLENYLQSAYEPDKREEYMNRLDRKLTPIEKLSEVFDNLSTDTPSYLYRIRALADDSNSGRII